MAMQKHPDLDRFRLLLNDPQMNENRQQSYWKETLASVGSDPGLGVGQGQGIGQGQGQGQRLGVYRHCHPLHIAVRCTESVEVVEMLLEMILEDEKALMKQYVDSNLIDLAQYLQRAPYTSGDPPHPSYLPTSSNT